MAEEIGMDNLNISVIIAAHNAEETIAETLASLQAQTYPNWEAIVVDDGSTDETLNILNRFAEKDIRMRVFRQRRGGEGRARNAGISQAKFNWYLFLDSDDWILPTALARFTEVLNSDAVSDAVYSGWARVAPDGTRIEETYRPDPTNLFPLLARFCPFAIHSCMVRGSVVKAVGCFDEDLSVGADWDLWQRIARTGARFRPIPGVLALYRMRTNSAVTDVHNLLVNGLQIITRGHSPDPRVTQPFPPYAGGVSKNDLPDARFYYVCWPAGMLLGRGEDARWVLDHIPNDQNPQLDPKDVAQAIFKAALISVGRTPDAWLEMWPRLHGKVFEFLEELESHAVARELARRAGRELERMIFEHGKAPRPSTCGKSQTVQIEVTEPMHDLIPPTPMQGLRCKVKLEGIDLGNIELPVCDGIIPAYVLADAIAAQFAWTILGRFFERTIYRDLRFEKETTRLSIYRGKLALVRGLSEGECESWARLHDRIGWTVFLQELWGRPDWLQDRFYNSAVREKTARARKIPGNVATVSVETEIPDLEVSHPLMDIEFMVGGAAVAFLTFPAEGKRVRAQQLRAWLNREMGFELCRAVVREGLIGVGAALNGSTLRELLTQSAKQAEKIDERPMSLNPIPDSASLAPSWARAVKRLFSQGGGGWVLGRHAGSASASSISRRALLPIASAPDLLDATRVTGQPVIQVAGEGAQRIWYAPDLLWKSCQKSSIQEKPSGERKGNLCKGSGYDRHHFESLFLKSPNPWSYETPYEQLKYQQTLSLLPPIPIDRALELACAEGFFTEMLAPRVKNLLATDISKVAIERASERCRQHQNVRFAQLDFIKDPLPGQFELIVCSEVLYFLEGERTLKTLAREFADSLEPGGHLLTAHTHVVADDPASPGLDWDVPFGAKRIGEILARTPSLRFIKELRTPLYRILLFQRKNSVWSYVPVRFRNSRPDSMEEVPNLPPAPHVAARFLMSGGKKTKGNIPQLMTYNLPILMYHQVAPFGPSYLDRYRVRPEVFEEQLRYLYDAGFYTMGLEEWWGFMQAQKPIPGRAVLLTFDDGYLDFLNYAWPLLKRYGFSAIVFLVASQIGHSNSWDQIYGEEVPLLGWKEIHQLQDEGVEFGSHTATHPYLTGLSPTDVVHEAARSRAILERGLKRPVTAFAYPHGAEDQMVQHLVGACGYIFGLSCRPGPSGFQDSLLALPRIEVSGFDGPKEFIAKLSFHPGGG